MMMTSTLSYNATQIGKAERTKSPICQLSCAKPYLYHVVVVVVVMCTKVKLEVAFQGLRAMNPKKTLVVCDGAS